MKKMTERNHPRIDRDGNPIEFKLSLDEFIDIFLPYKEDSRLYLTSNDPQRLCLCRNYDLGSYTIDNVYVDTRSNNNRDSHVFGDLQIKALLNYHREHPEGTFFGRKHQQEFFDKQSKTFKEIEHQQGDKNSQWGTCWIYNLNERKNRKIPLVELPEWESNGWTKGRKMSF